MPNTLTDTLPDITRPDATRTLLSEWAVGTRARQEAAMEAVAESWRALNWPGGLVSYTCFASADGTTLAHYSQWRDQEALDAFPGNGPPARWARILEAVPDIAHRGVGTYQLHASHVTAAGRDRDDATGCIVIVDIDFGGAGQEPQRQWCELVVAALEVEPPGGLLAAHLHVGVDQSRVINYAEWTSEQAHIGALSDGALRQRRRQAPEWDRVRSFPEVVDNSRFIRYPHHRAMRP